MAGVLAMSNPALAGGQTATAISGSSSGAESQSGAVAGSSSQSVANGGFSSSGAKATGGTSISAGGDAASQQSTNISFGGSKIDASAPQVFTAPPNNTADCLKTAGLSITTQLGGGGISGSKDDADCQFRAVAQLVGNISGRPVAAAMLCTHYPDVLAAYKALGLDCYASPNPPAPPPPQAALAPPAPAPAPPAPPSDAKPSDGERGELSPQQQNGVSNGPVAPDHSGPIPYDQLPKGT